MAGLNSALKRSLALYDLLYGGPEETAIERPKFKDV